MKIGPPVNNLFLVTSCINTDFGIYKPQERFEQTIETISSIRKYAPNSKIFIADNSYIKELNENVYKFFTQSCDFVAKTPMMQLSLSKKALAAAAQALQWPKR